MRTILPIIAVPLDEFGEGIVGGYEETLRLVEPELLDSKNSPVSVQPLWSKNTKSEFVQTILDKLAEIGHLDTLYENALPAQPVAFVFVVGSVSLHSDQCLSNFSQVLEAIESSRLGNQTRVVPLFDVSWFPEEEEISFKEKIEKITDVDKQYQLGEYYYLVDKGSYDRGVRARNRDDLAAAIQIYLEAVTLSGFWENYNQSWLNVIPESKETQFASFAVLSFVSPHSEMVKYLSNVSYYQLVHALDAEEPEIDENEFPPSTEVKQVQRQVEQGEFDEVKHLPPPPGIMNKEDYALAVEESRGHFYHRFNQWLHKKKEALESDHLLFSQVSVDNLEEYKISQREQYQKGAERERFIRRSRIFSTILRKELLQVEKSSEVRWQLPFYEAPAVSLDPEYDGIQRLTRRLPNFTSLLIHLAIMVAFYFLGVHRLIPLVKALKDPEANFVLLTGLYFFYGIFWVYLAWRLPAWRIKFRIQTKLLNAQRSLFNLHWRSFEDVYQDVTQHWHNKNLRNKKYLLQDRLNKIMRVLKYMDYTTEEGEAHYPYPEADWEKITAGLNMFRVFLEKPEAVERMGESLKIPTDEFLKRLKTIEEKPTDLVFDGDAEELEELLRTMIRGKYFERAKIEQTNYQERVRGAAVGYSGMKDQPLIRFMQVEGEHRSQFFCSSHPTIQDVLKIDQDDDIHLVGLAPNDRIYFFRTWYGIKADELIQ